MIFYGCMENGKVIIGVCGCVGEHEDLLNGQTVKTKEFINYVRDRKDISDVVIVDTWKWNKRKILLIINFVLMIYKSDCVYLFPAHNGVRIFVPMAVILGMFFKIKVYYMVIGGWLPELIDGNRMVRFFIKYISKIYVETASMKKDLKDIEITNVEVVHNFKKGLKVNRGERKYNRYKYCTFSRVIKEKGIEDAINAIVNLNNRMDGKYKLDIYGQIDDSYKERFERIMSTVPEYINYCGEVKSDEINGVLRKYRALLFPTYFYTEGQPGSVIDAYFAGIPIIAYEWRSAYEFIIEGKTGWIIKKDIKLLEEKIRYVSSIDLNEIQEECEKMALNFTSENVLKRII